MDANSVVENLIGTFLSTDLDNFKIHLMSVEEEIKKNHLDIIKFLKENDISEEVIHLLKNRLKV